MVDNRFISDEDDLIVTKPNQITYAKATVDEESANKLFAWLKEHKVPNLTKPSSFHTTIIYSRTPVKIEEHSLNIKADHKTYSWDLFDPYDSDQGKRILVLKFKSDKLHSIWQKAMQDGATYDHDRYNPHITVSTNIDNFNYKDLPLPDFDILLKEIKVSTFVDKSKEKTMSVEAKLSGIIPEKVLAKKRKLSERQKEGKDRNAVPGEKGGLKHLPEHPSKIKQKLLKEIHAHKDIQKMLEKHPTLDIIIVDKEKDNKSESKEDKKSKADKALKNLGHK